MNSPDFLKRSHNSQSQRLRVFNFELTKHFLTNVLAFLMAEPEPTIKNLNLFIVPKKDKVKFVSNFVLNFYKKKKHSLVLSQCFKFEYTTLHIKNSCISFFYFLNFNTKLCYILHVIINILHKSTCFYIFQTIIKRTLTILI